MTLVRVDIRDSRGAAIAGRVRVTLDHALFNDGALHLPVASSVELVDGVAMLDLEPSGFSNIPYKFDIVRIFPVSLEDGSTLNTEETVFTIRAKVPETSEILQLSDLQSTGFAEDLQDTSISTITRRFYRDPGFWAVMQQQLFRQKGRYSDTGFYQIGDMVSYRGNGYICVSYTPIQGINPTDPLAWKILVEKGETGAGGQGDIERFNVGSPSEWANDFNAVSKDAIADLFINHLALRSQVLAKADATNALLEGIPVRSQAPIPRESTSGLATTAWVQGELAVLRVALFRVGMSVAWFGTSEPSGWLLCDGRLIRTDTFGALFAIIGGVGNRGDEPQGFFRLPDLRGRGVIGLDFMSALMGAAGRVPGLNGVGQSGGAANITLNIDQIPSHNHGGVTAPMVGASNPRYLDSGSPANGVGLRVSYENTVEGATDLYNHRHGISAQGGNQAHSNMPPYTGANVIIYTGVTV